MNCVPQGMIGFGNFLAGRHEQAVAAGRRAVEMNPGFSILHGWLAAPLARLGRLDGAKASAARLMALDQHFTIGSWSAAVGLAPEIVDTIEAIGGDAAVADIAAHLGRPADGIYYHLRRLVDSGVLREGEDPGDGRGRRYRTAAQRGQRVRGEDGVAVG